MSALVKSGAERKDRSAQRDHTKSETRQEMNAALVSYGSLKRYLKFCVVGGTGMVVDMGIVYLLASPSMLGWNLSVSKVIAAEVAIFNNFIWNEIWTFKDCRGANSWKERQVRLGKFNLICLVGIGMSVLLLNAQVHWLRINMLVANFVAIVAASFWNFGMNKKLAWGYQ
jgi:dolichol-phosphate mannosyltransferase